MNDDQHDRTRTETARRHVIAALCGPAGGPRMNDDQHDRTSTENLCKHVVAILVGRREHRG